MTTRDKNKRAAIRCGYVALTGADAAFADGCEHTCRAIAKWLREKGYDQDLAEAIERGDYLL